MPPTRNRRRPLAAHMSGRLGAAFLAVGTILPAPCLAQGTEPAGARIWAKLQRAQLVDAYFPDAVLEVARSLSQAAPGQWRGVQVNDAYQVGALNIYLVDADRIRDDRMLADEGVDNFSPESLRGGALAHEDTGIVFVNTAAWKRMAAATLMKQLGAASDLTAAIATVDTLGLPATRRYWDAATLNLDTPENQRTGWLLRGAFAFVLAHEMGHLRIGRAPDAASGVVPLRALTDRQKDERFACPETLRAEFQARQSHELAADMAAVQMLGQQCRLGADGELRHQIYMLGSAWYFTYAMGDKLLLMGRNTSSPVIAQALRRLLGPQLYEQAVAGSGGHRRGAVRLAFPTTHPPDHARLQAIDQALRRTPCGGGGLDSTHAQMLEQFRLRTCQSLIAPQGAR